MGLWRVGREWWETGANLPEKEGGCTGADLGPKMRRVQDWRAFVTF
jgi:hypothetical protein